MQRRTIEINRRGIDWHAEAKRREAKMQKINERFEKVRRSSEKLLNETTPGPMIRNMDLSRRVEF